MKKLSVTPRDTVDGYIEALLEAHTEGLHDDAPQQSCPVCQQEERADGALLLTDSSS